MSELVQEFNEAWQWARYVNAVLALAVFGLLIASVWARWDYIPLRYRRILPWVVATYGVVAYGSVEVARTDPHIPPGYRVGLLSIVLIGMIVALLYGIGDKELTYSDRKRDFFRPHRCTEKRPQ